MRKFMRTRAPEDAPAHAPAMHKTNGVSNGVGSCLLYEERSTLSSRCWEGGVGGAVLWEDAEFPASAASLADRRRARRTRWARPHELCVRPRYLGDAAVEAGEVGAGVEEAEALRAVGTAAWAAGEGEGVEHLRAAAAALALTPRLLLRAAPPHSFRVGYCGRFTFSFWVFGTWREVVVDDRLPAPHDSRYALPRAASADFTLALLEKAYAKLLGGYAALRGGSLARALQDLSGGVVQSFAPPRQPRAALLHVLRAALPRATLLVAATAPTAPTAPAAAVVVEEIARGDDGGALLRLRAPSAGVAPHWLPFVEFAATYARLELVHLGPDEWLLEPALRARRPWRAVLARRRWRHGYNAGGPPSARTSHANPQFGVQVAGARAHVVLALAQEGAGALGVGFAVFAGAVGGAPLEGSHACRAREVATFFTLTAGRYVVVAHAARPHAEAAFLLRILADEHIDVWEVNEDNAIVRDVAGDGAEAARAAVAAAGARAALRGLSPAAALDARALQARLRRVWRRVLPARPALELCRALVALRDPGVTGRMPARELPALLALLALWRAALAAHAPSAYCVRALLRAAGLTASNKVVECVVLRYARGARLPPAAAVLALARLHLAHGTPLPSTPARPLPSALTRPLCCCRALPQPGGEAEVEPPLAGRDDPDDHLLVTSTRAATRRSVSPKSNAAKHYFLMFVLLLLRTAKELKPRPAGLVACSANRLVMQMYVGPQSASPVRDARATTK